MDYKNAEMQETVEIDGEVYCSASIVSASVIIPHKAYPDRCHTAVLQGFACDVNAILQFLEKSVGEVHVEIQNHWIAPIVKKDANDKQTNHTAFWGDPEFSGKPFESLPPLARPVKESTK